MGRWLGKNGELYYAAMRIVVGFLFACHGAQKLFGVLGGHSQLGFSLSTAAAVIEFAGGILVAFGLFAGFAAFIASGEMAVAYFKFHAPGGFWPVVNKGELAVLYCFIFLVIASRGSGPLSVDALVRKKGK